MMLFVIRHGETAWNRAGRLQGQLETDITARGRAQARRNGRVLAALLADRACRFRFVSSPLRRARQTMQLVRQALGCPCAPDADFVAQEEAANHAGHTQGFTTDARLKEIHFGRWQGETWDSLRAAGQGALIAARQAAPWHFTPPGGESYSTLSSRVLDWFAALTDDTIATAHGGVLRVLQGHLATLPKDEIPRLPIPQDKIMKIANGKVEWL